MLVSLYVELHCYLLFSSVLSGQVDIERNGFLSHDTGGTRQSETSFMLSNTTKSKTKIPFFYWAHILNIQLESLFDIALDQKIL